MARKWVIQKVVEDAMILPKGDFKCPFCKVNLIIHQFTVAYYPKKSFYHADVHMKCPKCGFFATFGVPLYKDEYEELLNSKHLGVVLTDELTQLDFDEGEKKLLEERLKDWGYW